MSLPPHEVVKQLSAAGYIADFLDYAENGATLLGTVRVPDVIERLKADARFANGVFYGLHRDVGADLIDFRSYSGVLGSGSLQLVIDKRTGKCYADIDGFNPYQDVVSVVGHLFGEVIFRKLFRRKGRAVHGSADSRTATLQHDCGDREAGDRGPAA